MGCSFSCCIRASAILEMRATTSRTPDTPWRVDTAIRGSFLIHTRERFNPYLWSYRTYAVDTAPTRSTINHSPPHLRNRHGPSSLTALTRLETKHCEYMTTPHSYHVQRSYNLQPNTDGHHYSCGRAALSLTHRTNAADTGHLPPLRHDRHQRPETNP